MGGNEKVSAAQPEVGVALKSATGSLEIITVCVMTSEPQSLVAVSSTV